MSDREYMAFAYGGGEIGFAPVSYGAGIPKGALFLAKGDRETITRVIGGLARHAYDETLLVPGCPEAQHEGDAYRAFCEFFHRVQKALGIDSNVADIRDLAVAKDAIERRTSRE